MIAGLLKLIAGIWSWLGRMLAGIGEWLREPHDWWRIGFFTVGACFALASFVAYDQHRTVIVVTRSAAADAETCSRIIAEKDAALADFKAQQQAFADAARKEAAALDAARKQSTQAMDDLKAAQDKAKRNSQAWWAGYANRPDTCRAAQEALDVACAEVKDY